MYQHIIGDKRASLSPAQRPCNGFCSTAAKRCRNCRLAAKLREKKRFRRRRRARRDRRRAWTSRRAAPHPAQSGDPLEDRMRERLLEIVAPRRRPSPRSRVAHEIIVPGAAPDRRRRRSDIVEPDFDGDQQPLRRADLEIVETDVGLDLERIRAGCAPSGPSADRAPGRRSWVRSRSCGSPGIARRGRAP